MPRTKAIPEREKAIGARVAEARRAHGFSRVSFSEGLFPTAETLGRVELGRVPLYYGMARKLWEKMPRLNPVFLAAGLPPIRLDIEIWLPPPEDISASSHTLFSAAISPFVDDLATLSGSEAGQRLPASWIPAQKFYLEFKRLGLRNLVAEIERLQARIDRLEVAAKNSEKKALTDTSLKRKSDDMRSELSQLLAQVKRATQGKGEKTRLAETLGVPPARVSEWLSGKKKPGGETTLRLLKWVQQLGR